MKVLIIEDSASVRAYIEGVLARAPDIELLPSAPDGAAGVEAVHRHHPDLVLMDLELPVLDGISAIAKIMATVPCPIVVLSAYLDTPGSDRTFEALEAGAVNVLAKPSGIAKDDIEGFAARLLSTVRLMAEARVVRRSPDRILGAKSAPVPKSAPSSLLVIGASTGGPAALRELLRNMIAPAPVPIIIAQHTIPGFEHGLAAWLSETGHHVIVADGLSRLAPGAVYLSPADKDVVVREGFVEVVSPRPGTQVPSINRLFESAAEAHGKRTAAVLLTGMGDDGAEGALSLYRRGALTITQTASSCVINGMPEAARRLGASTIELPPLEIARFLGALHAQTRKRETVPKYD